jgi:hypothetical protein
MPPTLRLPSNSTTSSVPISLEGASFRRERAAQVSVACKQSRCDDCTGKTVVVGRRASGRVVDVEPMRLRARDEKTTSKTSGKGAGKGS